MFSTHNTGSGLYARTLNGGTASDVLIPGSWLNSPHRYRIDWLTSEVRFFIDGSLVHTRADGDQRRPCAR